MFLCPESTFTYNIFVSLETTNLPQTVFFIYLFTFISVVLLASISDWRIKKHIVFVERGVKNSRIV